MARHEVSSVVRRGPWSRAASAVELRGVAWGRAAWRGVGDELRAVVSRCWVEEGGRGSLGAGGGSGALC